jgi:hypothetical protein
MLLFYFSHTAADRIKNILTNIHVKVKQSHYRP